MKHPSTQVVVEPGPELEVTLAPPHSRELLELWFKLSRRPWRSVALVPADAGGSTADTARALADIGRQLRDAPVTALVQEQLDFTSAGALADEIRAFASSPERGCVVVSVPPLVVEPLGTAAVQASDAVILCVDLGRARLASARRTMELVGRDRVAGCVLLR